MAAQYPIRCFFSVASAPGTGAIPVGTALPAYTTPKSQNYTSGAKLPYVAIDGSNFEAGIGVYTNNNGVESIARGLRFSTSGALINLTASAQVMIAPAMQDQITANNASNGDGADHLIKIGWNGSRLVFDLDNAGAVGILLSDADLTSITSQFAGVQTILTQLNRAVTVLDLLRSVSAVALNAVGFLDDYADNSGADTANSTGVIYATGNINNMSGNGGTQYAVETASNAQFSSGGGANPTAAPSDSSLIFSTGDYQTTGGYSKFAAFSNYTPNGWCTNTSSPSFPVYVGRIFNAAQTYFGYSLTACGEPGRMAKSWQLQGSNDTTTGNDGTWTTLDTQTNVAAWTAEETRRYTLPGTTAYKAYRLYVTAGQAGSSDYCRVGPIRFFNQCVAPATTNQIPDGSSSSVTVSAAVNSSRASDGWTAQSIYSTNLTYNGQVTTINSFSNYSYVPACNTLFNGTAGSEAAGFTAGNQSSSAYEYLQQSTMWIEAVLPAAIVCTAIGIGTKSGDTSAPMGAIIKGSNDGNTYTTLANAVGQVTKGVGTGDGNILVLQFANTTAYKYYRVYFTGSSYGNINEFAVYKTSFNPAPAAMSLRSVRATLKYTPQRVYYSGVLKMAGGVLNTDLKASVTRDGATYTAGTLVQLFTRSDGASIYELQDGSGKPGVDVTGQPSGQAVGYKLDATAAYRQDAYAADLRAA